MKNIFFTVTAVVLTIVVVNAHAGGDYLLTEDEAMQLNMTDDEWNTPLNIQLRSEEENGPIIIIEKPEIDNKVNEPVVDTTTPVDLVVLFKDRAASVDISTLKIVARKGIFSRNITDRLRKYIAGNKINATDIKVPKGKFKLEVKIKDTKGNKTTKVYKLLVS